MKWPLCLVLAAACQSGDAKDSAPSNTKIVQLPKAQVTDAYRADITTLCDVLRLSGADAKPKAERWSAVAWYLNTEIKTNEANEFIVALKPLPPDAYALALENEGKRVGLATCELANEWRNAAANSAGAGSGN
jgi:hypothetical protein